MSVFGTNDPMLMGTLHIAFLTLFRCATLEDWTDVMYINMLGTRTYPCRMDVARTCADVGIRWQGAPTTDTTETRTCAQTVNHKA